MSFEIKLDDDQIKQAVDGAIVSLLSDEAKEELIGQAIAHLTKDRVYKDGYSTKQGPSPVMEAFNRELERLVREEMRNQIENNPEFNTVIEDTVKDVIAQAILDRKGFWIKLANKSADAMEEWLREERGVRF